jgi:hypothetical protein
MHERAPVANSEPVDCTVDVDSSALVDMKEPNINEITILHILFI